LILLGLATTKAKEGTVYKLAVAMLLLSAPAFAQDSKVDMPQTNLKNTVIPKSGGQQTPETTPTKAGESTPTDATATRPSKDGPQQASTPNSAPAVTTTQTTGESNQSDTIRTMNEDAKKKLETEGK
jgi:hypothetical protein